MSDLTLDTSDNVCLIWYWTHQTMYVWFNNGHIRQCTSDLILDIRDNICLI